MNDSIELLPPGVDTARRLHGVINKSKDKSGGGGGHIYKGSASVPPNSTIPSRYQTIVINNSDSRGFGSQAKRFQYESAEDTNPSPVAYQRGAQNGAENDSSPSWSKRGTGGFASKDKRGVRLVPNPGPGPARYNTSKKFSSTEDYSYAPTSSAFATNIAVAREKPSEIPAPNVYNLSNTAPPNYKTNNVSAVAAFASKTRRDFLNMAEQASKPGPGRYAIDKSDKVMSHGADRAHVSCFRSTSKRDPEIRRSCAPGPGAYDHERVDITQVERQLFPKKHYLCLSAPALPMPKTPPGPGPGQYELRTKMVPKHYMSSPMFLSNTSRWSNFTAGGRFGPQPGPAHYQPTAAIGQVSFHYNTDSKWVC